MMKKYEFTGETKTIQLAFKTVTLHRIRAVADFGKIKDGDIGGWLEKEENLSQEGEAWVYDNAEVYGSAKVCGNAYVCDNARVSGNARVSDNAWVSGNAKVGGNAEVYGNAKVCGNAVVYDNAKVLGNAKVWGNAKVLGNAKVWGNAKVCDNARVSCNARVSDNAWVSGNAKVGGNAEVYGNAEVCGNAVVYDNAKVFLSSHVMVIGAIGSRSDFTTFYRGNDNQIMVKCGCFNDTIDKFIDKVKSTHGDNKHALVYQKAAELAKIQIDLSCEPQESEDNE